jgi:hypothetical protein
MRLLVWLFLGLWNGSKGSLIAAIILLAAGLLAAYFMVLPYFNPPLQLTAEDFVDLNMPSALQRVEFSGEMVDGNQSVTRDGENLNYGIIEMDNQLYRLLLVASAEPLDEDQTEFHGTLVGRNPFHLNIFEDIVDDENLEGRAIEALFIMGEPEQDTVMAYFVVDALLLGLAILGLSRYIYLRSKAA